jgi:hypothetical protein
MKTMKLFVCGVFAVILTLSCSNGTTDDNSGGSGGTGGGQPGGQQPGGDTPSSFAGVNLDIAINRTDNPGSTQFTFVVTPAGADSYQVKKGAASTQAMTDWGQFLDATLNALSVAAPSAYTGPIGTTHTNIQNNSNIVPGGAIVGANTATAAVMSNWAAILNLLNSNQEIAAEYNPIIISTMPRLWFNEVSSANMTANTLAWLKAHGYPRVNVLQ